MPEVKKLVRPEPGFVKQRVAAYARVSRETPALRHSLSAQVDYYTSLIRRNPAWELAGVYVDAGLTGTSIRARPEFQRLIKDSRAGKIDLVLTKSVSRFARNTVELLATVRDFKTWGVEVRFETEGINTMSGEGELMLTLLASFAQEESLSLSRNVKWAIDKKYREGRPHAHQKLFGYRWQGEERVIVPEEAELVRFIFDSYTGGKSVAWIVDELSSQGRRGARGRPFTRSGVWTILSNEEYTGCLILQQSYNHRPRKSKRNRGEVAMYLVEDHYPAIITGEQFDRAAAIRKQRQNRRRMTAPAENGRELHRKRES